MAQEDTTIPRIDVFPMTYIDEDGNEVSGKCRVVHDDRYDSKYIAGCDPYDLDKVTSNSITVTTKVIDYSKL